MPAPRPGSGSWLRRFAAAVVVVASTIVLGAFAYRGAELTNRWARGVARPSSEGAAVLFDCLGRAVRDVVPAGSRVHTPALDGYGHTLVEYNFRYVQFVASPEEAELVLGLEQDPSAPCGGMRVTATAP